LIERLIYRVKQKEEMSGVGKKKENILGNSNAANIESTQASSLAPGSASMGGGKALAPLTQVKDKFAA